MHTYLQISNIYDLVNIQWWQIATNVPSIYILKKFFGIFFNKKHVFEQAYEVFLKFAVIPV